MDTEMTNDTAIAARLRRLGAGAGDTVPFSYDGLMDRHASGLARSRRRHRVARATAASLVIALAGASLWRLEPTQSRSVVAVAAVEAAPAANSQPRLVRAGSYLAVAALEDHIARVDDALNDARIGGDLEGAARLERTRAELMNSYTHVRYAEMLSASL